MKFDLTILPQAERDIDLIVNFLYSESPRGANSWYRQWMSTCATLRKTADSFGLAPEDADNPFTVQQLVFKTRYGKPYRVLYRLVDRMVYVYHVRGPGQDFVDLGDIQLPGSEQE